MFCDPTAWLSELVKNGDCIKSSIIELRNIKVV